MVELFEQNIKTDGRKSSKGNQLKWMNGKDWYKADFTGYEGLAEYTVSHLLQFSTLKKDDYILYHTEQIHYAYREYLGCKSQNFLPKGWQLITLERLFQNFYGESLNKCIYHIEKTEDRVRFLVDQIIRITGLEDFGKYISILMTIDAFFLNEDRHTHNMAVLVDEQEQYHYCPVFDNGAALLADTAMDYPVDMEAEYLIGRVKAKTFCRDFDEQLSAAETLYGQHIRFQFSREEVQKILDKEPYYPNTVKERVVRILSEQKRKYSYLFVPK